MTSPSGDRSRYWPAIEKKYGEPVECWLAIMETLAGRTYEDQVAHLRENFGFSRTHANAVVMYSRGSTTSRRFDTLDSYLATADPTAQRTIRAIVAAVRKADPDINVVIAWNHPMLKLGDQYILGLSVAKAHILIAPWGAGVLDAFRSRLVGYTVNKKTIRVPIDWDVDAAVLNDLAAAHRAQPGEPSTG